MDYIQNPKIFVNLRMTFHRNLMWQPWGRWKVEMLSCCPHAESRQGRRKSTVTTPPKMQQEIASKRHMFHQNDKKYSQRINTLMNSFTLYFIRENLKENND